MSTGRVPGLALGDCPPSWPCSMVDHGPPPHTFLQLTSLSLQHGTTNMHLTNLNALPSQPFSTMKHEPPPQDNPHSTPCTFVQLTPSSLQHETMDTHYAGRHSPLRCRVTTTLMLSPRSSPSPPLPRPSSASSVGHLNHLYELQPVPYGPGSPAREELPGERTLGFRYPAPLYSLFAVRGPSTLSKHQVCINRFSCPCALNPCEDDSLCAHPVLRLPPHSPHHPLPPQLKSWIDCASSCLQQTPVSRLSSQVLLLFFSSYSP